MSRPSPAENATSGPCTYGLAPDAHPAIGAFADRVRAILAETEAHGVPARVAEALHPLLGQADLLHAAVREGDAERYRKHVLYADPEHRFTFLALVWLPGQATVIHGHTAWCAVGVYEGRPNVACYDCREVSPGRHVADLQTDRQFGPGDTAAVRPGLADVHRIYNDTDEKVVTLHMYGCDLLDEPDAINLDVNL